MVSTLKTIIILFVCITFSCGAPSPKSRRISKPFSRQNEININHVLKSENKMPKLNKAHYNGKGYRQFLEAIKTPKIIKPDEFAKYVKQVKLSNEESYARSKQDEAATKNSEHNDVNPTQNFKHKLVVKPKDLNYMIELVRILNKEENNLSNK